MNGLKCPNCSLVNMTSATECYRCRTSLINLPPTAEVSVPVEETFQAQAFAPYGQNQFLDVGLGRKTFFWYRVYLAVLALLSLVIAGFGVFAFFLSQEPSLPQREAQEMLLAGIIYGGMGLIFGVIYLIALFLPKKPWNWVVGIIIIALGMTMCCSLPAAIPLLIFWIKPETQAFFGRR